MPKRPCFASIDAQYSMKPGGSTSPNASRASRDKSRARRLIDVRVGHRQTAPMFRRSRTSRFASWAAVCVLLLNAAAPMLVAGAAQLRGVSAAEVCPLYGIAQLGGQHSRHAGMADHQRHSHHDGHDSQSSGSHSGESHSGADCALTALAAFAVFDIASPTNAMSTCTSIPAHRFETSNAFNDACATWVARLKHGPPAFA